MKNCGPHQHHAVGILLADLANEQGSHAGPCAATQGVADLEACAQGLRVSYKMINIASETVKQSIEEFKGQQL